MKLKLWMPRRLFWILLMFVYVTCIVIILSGIGLDTRMETSISCALAWFIGGMTRGLAEHYWE